MPLGAVQHSLPRHIVAAGSRSTSTSYYGFRSHSRQNVIQRVLHEEHTAAPSYASSGDPNQDQANSPLLNQMAIMQQQVEQLTNLIGSMHQQNQLLTQRVVDLGQKLEALQTPSPETTNTAASAPPSPPATPSPAATPAPALATAEAPPAKKRRPRKPRTPPASASAQPATPPPSKPASTLSPSPTTATPMPSARAAQSPSTAAPTSAPNSATPATATPATSQKAAAPASVGTTATATTAAQNRVWQPPPPPATPAPPAPAPPTSASSTTPPPPAPQTPTPAPTHSKGYLPKAATSEFTTLADLQRTGTPAAPSSGTEDMPVLARPRPNPQAIRDTLLNGDMARRLQARSLRSRLEGGGELAKGSAVGRKVLDAESLEEARVVCEKGLRRADAADVLAMLESLAAREDEEGGERAQVQATVKKLLAKLEPSLPSLPTVAATAALQAATELGAEVPASFQQQLFAAVQPNQLEPEELVDMLEAAVQLHLQVPQQWAQSALAHWQANASAWGAPAACQLLQSFCALRAAPSQEQLAATAQVLQERLVDLESEDVAAALRAMQMLGGRTPPPQLAEALTAATLAAAPTMSPPDLATAFQAALNLSPTSFAALAPTLLHHSAPHLHSLDLASLVAIITSLALTRQTPPPPWTRAFIQATSEKLPDLNPPQAQALLHALATLSIPTDTMTTTAILAPLIPRLPSLPPAQLLTILTSVAALGTPPSSSLWLSQLVTAFLDASPTISPASASTIATSVVGLRQQLQPEHLDALLARTAGGFVHLTRDGLDAMWKLLSATGRLPQHQVLSELLAASDRLVLETSQQVVDHIESLAALQVPLNTPVHPAAGPGVTLPSLLDGLLETLASSTSANPLPPKTLARVFTALATLSHPPPATIASTLLAPLTTTFTTKDAASISSIIAAANTLGVQLPADLLNNFFAASIADPATLDDASLAATARTLASYGPERGSFWTHSFADEVFRRKHEMSASAFCGALGALAEAAHQPEPEWLGPVGKAVRVKLAAADAAGVAAAVRALGAWRYATSEGLRAELVHAAAQRQQQLGSAQAVDVLWGLSRLGVERLSGSFMAALTAKAQAGFPKATAAQLVNCASALAHFDHRPEDRWLSGFCQAATRSAVQLGAAGVGSLVASLSKLAYRPPEALLALLAEDLEQHVHRYAWPQLQQIVGAFAAWGHPLHEKLLSSYAKNMAAALKGADPDGALRDLTALIKCGGRPADALISKVFDQVNKAVAAGRTPAQKAAFLFAAAKLRAPVDEQLLEALHGAVGSTVVELSVSELAQVCWASAALGQRVPQAWVLVLAERLAAEPGAVGGEDLALALHAIARCADSGSANVAVGAAAAAAVSVAAPRVLKVAGARLAAMDAVQAGMLVGALARLGWSVPDVVVQGAAVRINGGLVRLGIEDLGAAVEGLARLGYRPGEKQVVRYILRLSPLLKAAPPAPLVAFLSGVAAMGFTREDQDWLKAISIRIFVQMQQLSPEELTDLAASFTTLSFSPGSKFLNTLCQEATPKLPQLPAPALLRLLASLQHLKHPLPTAFLTAYGAAAAEKLRDLNGQQVLHLLALLAACGREAAMQLGPLGPKLQDRLAGKLAVYQAGQLVAILQQLLACGHQPDRGFLASLSKHLQLQLNRLQPQEWETLLSCYSQTLPTFPLDPSLRRDLSAHAPTWPSLASTDPDAFCLKISTTLDLLKSLNCPLPPPSFCERLAAVDPANLSAAKPASMALLLRALATHRVPVTNQTWVDGLLQAFCSTLKHADAASLAYVAYTLTLLNQVSPDAKRWQQVVRQAGLKAADLDAPSLARLLAAIKSQAFRVTPEEACLKSVAKAAQARFDDAEPHILATIGFSLASLSAPVERAWLDSFLTASLQKLPGSNPVALTNTLLAARLFEHTPAAEWLEAVYARAHSIRADLSDAQLLLVASSMEQHSMVWVAAREAVEEWVVEARGREVEHGRAGEAVVVFEHMLELS